MENFNFFEKIRIEVTPGDNIYVWLFALACTKFCDFGKTYITENIKKTVFSSFTIYFIINMPNIK